MSRPASLVLRESGSKVRLALRAALALAGGLLLPGCTTLDYYSQAISGHLDIVWRAAPIEAQLRDPAVTASLKARLQRALAIRDFASRELQLPDNASYRRYTDLGRPFVVWNVFAAPEFSVKPLESCFPFAGCVSYRGFYSERAALRKAAELRDQGYDTYVGGVPAYSTLGWFDDPVLSTFIHYPDAELARLIFHELAHQVVYVRDDSAFNESFAVAVEQEGVRRWLAQYGSPGDAERYQVLRSRRREAVALILRHRNLLEKFYEQPLAEPDRRSGKLRIFENMRREYETLRAFSWGGYAGFDRLFSQSPSNAFVASIATYTQLVPAFEALLRLHGGDLPAFYRGVKDLSEMSPSERARRLGPGAAGGERPPARSG